MDALTRSRIFAQVRKYEREVCRVGLRSSCWFALVTMPFVALIHGQLYALPLAVCALGFGGGCSVARRTLFATIAAYELAHNTLTGFDVTRTFGSDLESETVLPVKKQEAFQRLCAWITVEGCGSFSLCNEDAGEIIARVRCSAVSDPHDVFVRVTEENGQSKISTRVVASAVNPYPNCFEIESQLLIAAREYPVGKEERKASSKWMMPLYVPRVVKGLLVIPFILLFSYANQRPEVDNLLSAGKYAQAEQALKVAQTPDMAYSQQMFLALAGQGKYDEATSFLLERDNDYLAFALASKGDFKGAQQAVQSRPPDAFNSDLSARYLAKAMIAESEGNKSQAFDYLTIARDASSSLLGLEKQAEVSMYKKLGKVGIANRIAAQLKEEQSNSLEAVRRDYAGLVGWTAAMLAAALAIPAWLHKRWHKTPGRLPPVDDVESELEYNMDFHQSFDRCLMSLSNSGCTITSMDDENGSVEAIDPDGTHLTINLTAQEEGVRISLKAPGTQPKGRQCISRLAEALQQQC